MDKIKALLKEYFDIKNSKKAAVVVAFIGIVGIALILFSDFLISKPSSENENIDENNISAEDIEILEDKLSGIISKIKGAGKTYVMITLEASKEYVFAKSSDNEISENDSDRKNSEKTEIAIIDSESGEEPLVTRIDEAKIRGVFIVCEGGENKVLKEKIIEAVCALLNVPSNKVSIAGSA